MGGGDILRSQLVRRKLTLEALEQRQLLAVTLGTGPVIDVASCRATVGRVGGINPTNPNCIVIVSNNNAALACSRPSATMARTGRQTIPTDSA